MEESSGKQLVRRRLATTVAVTGVVVAASLAALFGSPTSSPERGLYPAGTPSPSGWQPGIVYVRNLYGNMTITPAPGQIGTHVDLYWSTVQPSIYNTPDWRPAQTRVAYAAAEGLQAWLSLQIFENDMTSGTDGNLIDDLYLPAGVATVTYSSGGSGTCISNEVAPNYSAPAFLGPYATVVASMMSTFGTDANVGGFAVQMGAGGEAQNVQNESSCSTKKSSFEAVVSCGDYLNAVISAARWHRAGTDKPVTLASNIAACYATAYNSGRKAAKYFFEALNTAAATPQFIAYRNNGLAPDYSDAYWATPTPGPFGKTQYAKAHPNDGGVAFEPGLFPSSIATVDVRGYTDFMLLNAAAHNADHVFLQKEWQPYISSNVLNVVTSTLGTTASNSPVAWLWFREAEYKRNNLGGYDFNGAPGPFTHLAGLVTSATPTTYCSPAVATAAAANGGSAPPNACSSTLSTPAAPESRNALGYAAGSTVGIDIQDDWFRASANNTAYSVTLRYLDTTGSIVVAWRNAAGAETTRTITKGGSGIWQSDTFAITAALSDQYTTHDLEIRLSGAATILNSLVLTYTEVGTPTPTLTPSATATFTHTPTFTPTPTFTFTPTQTNTPTITPTPSRTLTPSPTTTATATPQASVLINEICMNPALDNNGDGAINSGDRYVELYNTVSNKNVDLSGWSLAFDDTVIETSRYVLSSQDRLNGAGYLVIYGSDLEELRTAGGVTLRTSWNYQADAVTYSTQTGNNCYARVPSGGSWTANRTQTLGKAN